LHVNLGELVKTNQLEILVNRSVRLLLVIVLVILVFSLPACANPKRGAATPDRVVESYLDALEAKDRDAIIRLGVEDANFARSVNAKVDRLGGRKIKERKVSYTKPKPFLWEAKIDGVYADLNGVKKKFEDAIVLEYLSKGELKLYAGRWYLSFDRPKIE
jgi:hypothetical protein